MALARQLLSLGSALRHTSRLARYTVTSQPTRHYADMAFTFASPGDVFYNKAKVNQVDVPSMSGSFGILPDHVPTLGVLKPGVVTVFEDDGAKKFFVSSGSITINDDSSVQILAEEAHPVESLDASAIRDGLAKAQQDLSAASTDAAKAEAQIALECYEALQKALE
ncbi:ATP synthase subunit delta, mitochondrial [Octopus bimaculoides]|uniref:ATP synthase F(1) complex subunit delta, mitochondrial n=1 Tax=Octopus bimaculoides TaxID=37653 RepID=A0A0L8FQ97_OCTBM|nr:ATP synthase subunit delta, mitochondrial [Octopus bimaculoides]|eukprot:XP_014787876.1 PREDICTED: ATP synthase subunit delta, mitochondrial-like [Octopus bimaculoides]